MVDTAFIQDEDGRLVRLKEDLNEAREALSLSEDAVGECLQALKEQQREQDLLRFVVAAVGRADDLESVLQAVLDYIGCFLRWPVGQAWTLEDGADEKLLPTRLWHVKDPVLWEAIKKYPTGGSGGLGRISSERAMATGMPVWVGDVGRALGLESGGVLDRGALPPVRSILAFPALVGAEVVAVFEFYSSSCASPIPAWMELLEVIGRQVGFLFERQRVQAELSRAKRNATPARTAGGSPHPWMSADELALAIRQRNEFVEIITEELRQPLHGVLGFARLLQDPNTGPLTDNQSVYLRTLAQNGERLLALANDLVDLSGIQSRPDKLWITRIGLHGVCQRCMKMVEQAALQKRIELTLNIDERVQTLAADERRLKQMLLNLLRNAIEFTPADGQVGLSVMGMPALHQVTLTVWDTGMGLSPEDQMVIFGTKAATSRSHRSRHGGPPLGFKLVRRLTELHRGSVSLQSEVGRGSRFTLTLPWSADAEQEAVVPPRPLEMATVNRAEVIAGPVEDRTSLWPLVLVAEDNEVNAKLVLTQLERLHCRAIVARTGREAVDRAIQHQPDLILMDVQLPELDGLQATAILKSRTETAHIPIVALTAFSMSFDRRDCIAAGVDGYLAKPFKAAALTQMVQAHLLSARRRRKPACGAPAAGALGSQEP